MIDLTLRLCFGGLVLTILLALYRLARGPTALDRILAFDLIAISVVGMIVLLSVLWHTPLYVELIVFSLLGFFSTPGVRVLLAQDARHRGRPRRDLPPGNTTSHLADSAAGDFTWPATDRTWIPSGHLQAHYRFLYRANRLQLSVWNRRPSLAWCELIGFR